MIPGTGLAPVSRPAGDPCVVYRTAHQSSGGTACFPRVPAGAGSGMFPSSVPVRAAGLPLAPRLSRGAVGLLDVFQAPAHLRDRVGAPVGAHGGHLVTGIGL